MQSVIRSFYDPMEATVCFLDLISCIYAYVLEHAAVPRFVKMLECVNRTARGLEGDMARLIIDYMNAVRVVEPHGSFNSHGLSVGQSTSLLITADEGVTEYFNIGAGSSVADRVKEEMEGLGPYGSAPVSRSGTAGRSRGQSRSRSRGGTGRLTGSRQDTTPGTPVPGGASIESFWSGGGGDDDFQNVIETVSESGSPMGAGAAVGFTASVHSDTFGLPPPDDMSVGAGAVARRLNSLAERPKTALSQCDLEPEVQLIHKHEDPFAPSLSRMLQTSVPVMSFDVDGRAKSVLGARGAPTNTGALSPPVPESVRKFQKDLVRAMSSSAIKRSKSSQGRGQNKANK
jgi:hypothetical protein